jgi:hypothetical protein
MTALKPGDLLAEEALEFAGPREERVASRRSASSGR